MSKPKTAKPSKKPAPEPKPEPKKSRKKAAPTEPERNEVVGVRLTTAEKEAFEAAIAKDGFRASTFLRAVCLALPERGAARLLYGAHVAPNAPIAPTSAPAPVHAPGPDAAAFSALVAGVAAVIRDELARDRELRASAPVASRETTTAPRARAKRAPEPEPEPEPDPNSLAARRARLEALADEPSPPVAPVVSVAPVAPAPEKQLTIDDVAPDAAKTFIVEKAGRACEVCGEECPKGSTAAWPRAKGVTGMVHVKCWPQSGALRRSDSRDA